MISKGTRGGSKKGCFHNAHNFFFCRALQAEAQAQRAEKMAKEVLGKLETALSRLEKMAAAQSINTTTTNSTTTNTTTTNAADSTAFVSKQKPSNGVHQPSEELRELREEKQNLPSWSVALSEVELTTQEVGRGRWGVVKLATYKGVDVAARCLFRRVVHSENRKTLVKDMDAVMKLRHPNLLPLLGVVLEEEPIILTELMPMNLRKVLDLGQLYNYQIASIALDVVSALQFLHAAKPNPLFHGDIPSSSVLVQKVPGNQWSVKLYKFMLSNFFRANATKVLSTESSFDRDGSISPTDSRSSTPRVTPPPSFLGYRKRLSGSDLALNRRMSSRKHSQTTAPDALDHTILTPERDVYSFGLLLVEMCTGTQPLEVSLQFLVESITWSEVFSIVKTCTEHNPKRRPTVDSLVATLTNIHHSFATRPAKFK